MWPAFFFVLGTFVGSFLNVCIWRLPRAESLILPPSHCIYCNARIEWWENIPLFSFIALKGRCRYCNRKIPSRYFVVELLTGLIYGVLAFKYGLSLNLGIWLILVSALVVVAFIDLEHRLILDRITYPGMAAGIVASLAIFPRGPINSIFSSILGLVCGGGILLILAVATRGGMGVGDVKLGAMVGAFLGWRLVLLALFLASFSGAIVGTILILARLPKTRSLKEAWRKGRQIPFGPYIALGTLIAILSGEAILNFYLGLGR